MDAIHAILGSKAIQLFKHEMCQLHLRHICELISIACLVAQGDYKTQRAFTQEYSPPKIFSALRRLYAPFFPQPCTVTTTPDPLHGQRHHLEAGNVPGAYEERDITRLWNASGNHLHRASVTKYLSTSLEKPPPSLDPIHEAMDGITRLLSSHIVAVRGEGPKRTLLQVVMSDEEDRVAARFLRVDSDTATISIEEFYGLVVRP